MNLTAALVKYPGWENDINLLNPPRKQPPFFFEANFRSLSMVDYPYNDVRWPIMSKKMYNVLTSCGSFPHESVQITMIDDTIMTENRYDTRGNPVPGLENHHFLAVRLLEKLDIFDWDRSHYEEEKDYPGFALNITKLVLKPKHSEYPPLFRISAYPTALFVSRAARDSLVNADVKGVKFIDLSEFRG